MLLACLQGPGASIPLVQLLVWSAECAVQRLSSSCAKLDNMQGISTAQITWLAHLATRRETMVIPTANCMGYVRSTRWDGRVDANRDFPYSRRDDRCFLSTSARLFKAIMETSIIQSVVTFHGGMVALGYEWGSRNHNRPKDHSPDENAHRSIGELMSSYAGTFAGEKPYPGMEDSSPSYTVFVFLCCGWALERL
jgi:predicted deacylase